MAKIKIKKKYFKPTLQGNVEVKLVSLEDIDGNNLLKESVEAKYDPKTKTIFTEVELNDYDRKQQGPLKATFLIYGSFRDLDVSYI